MGNTNFNSRSVDNLKALFNIVTGLSIAESVKSIIYLNTNTVSLATNLLPMFFALLITVIPFHQGASRYLDQTYIANQNTLKPLQGIIDYLFFITEAVIFYAAALSVKNPSFFFLLIIIVLFVDVIWLATLFNKEHTSFDQVKFWMLINVITIIIMAILNYTSLLNDGIVKWLILLLISVIRTSLDYLTTWKFYWPETNTN